jgi:hypothetical protein
MVTLFKVSDKEYSIAHGNQVHEACSVENVISLMRELHIDLDEIEMGLLELTKNNHNAAYYGVNNLFTFSSRKAA